jgi:hypothetical protein
MCARASALNIPQSLALHPGMKTAGFRSPVKGMFYQSWIKV